MSHQIEPTEDEVYAACLAWIRVYERHQAQKHLDEKTGRMKHGGTLRECIHAALKAAAEVRAK